MLRNGKTHNSMRRAWLPHTGSAPQRDARGAARLRLPPWAMATAASVLLAWPLSADAARLKDLADVRGVRANQLVGYGLVAGLSGTGDDQMARISVQSVVTMLKRLGVNVRDERLRLRNVAAVMVTAELPAFAAPGQKLDVTVASIGSATTLQGGVLLTTPLKGADGKVYAVAQGPLSVGGFSFAGRSGSRVQKNYSTVGRVPGGALVEREVDVELAQQSMQIALRRPDFTTAARIAAAINAHLGSDDGADTADANTGPEAGDAPEAAPEDADAETALAAEEAAESAEDNAEWAKARDSGTVQVQIPDAYSDSVPALIAELEALEVEEDVPTRVVVNERTGTVVLGTRVQLRPVAIAHGGLTLSVSERFNTSQPAPLGRGETAVTPESELNASEQEAPLQEVPASAELGDVVKALNALGVSPRALVAILQALKSSGALNAQLVIQ